MAVPPFSIPVLMVSVSLPPGSVTTLMTAQMLAMRSTVVSDHADTYINEMTSGNVFVISHYQVCTEDQYECPDGDCIFAFWECDGFSDCSDGSDEANCSKDVSLHIQHVVCVYLYGN